MSSTGHRAPKSHSSNDALPSRFTVISRVGSGALTSHTTHDATVTPPLCHFERSKAEPRNLTPHMTPLSPASLSFRAKQSGVEKSPPTHDTSISTAGDLGALRQQYRMPLSPYPHVPPLEMTMAAGSLTAISKRTQMTTLSSRLSVISRVGSGALTSHSSHDTTANPPLCHFERSEAESRNLTPQ